MNADERVVRLVQQVDRERQDRLKAQRQMRALQAQNAQLRRQLTVMAQDARRERSPQSPVGKPA
jgi:acetyl-CoA acetyltransferase